MIRKIGHSSIAATLCSSALLPVLMVVGLLVGCKRKQTQIGDMADGRVLNTRMQTLTMLGLRIAGKLPSNWNKYDRSRDTNTKEGAFVTFFSRAPGISTVCVKVVLQVFHCMNGKCKKERIGLLKRIRNDLWVGFCSFLPVIMGVKHSRGVIVVHRLKGSNSFLECRVDYQCDDNARMIIELKDMCANLKISKTDM